MDAAPHPAPVAATPILRSGQNCWRVVQANRAAILVDGAAYFAALAESLALADRSITIIGWDFDGRIALRPDLPPEERCPLGPHLRRLVEAKPELEIRILVWSIAVLHAPGSPSELLLGAAWQKHPRIRVKLDGEHPVYAAHHQKIVVVDDSLAFVGGMDLTVGRWDTPDHRADDPRRIDPDGKPYPPVHDVQMMVDGEAARSVAEAAQARWRAAAKENPPPVPRRDLWPASVPPSFGGPWIGIARTAPGWGEAPAHAEGAVLTADMLKAARRCIYLEAQYLTADFVRDALAAQLERPDGPEVVVVLTRESHGLAEQWVMGHNRDHLLSRLKEADRHGRLRAFYPVVPAPNGEREVLIHAKLAIIDDRLLRVGSSNLNNRSIALDTECDLAIEAVTEPEREAISDIRDRLLAEHLCATPEAVREAVGRRGSLIGAIDELNCDTRCLRPFDLDKVKRQKGQVIGTILFDPKRPFRLLAPFMRRLAFLRRPAPPNAGRRARSQRAS